MERVKHPMQEELDSLVRHKRGNRISNSNVEMQQNLALKRLQKPFHQLEEEDRMFRDMARQLLDKEAFNAILDGKSSSLT
jgi:hypothetical protein